MTRAEANILAYLEARGASTYATICDQFNLMSKNAIDDALMTLIEAGRVTQGSESAKREYWAISTGKKPKPNLLQVAMQWVADRKIPEFDTTDLRSALPNGKARVASLLEILAEKGIIESIGRGRWRRNTPSEAAATRKAGAPAPSEMPEVVATPIPVGDALDVSALESPSPAIGPAAAFRERQQLMDHENKRLTKVMEVINERPAASEQWAEEELEAMTEKEPYLPNRTATAAEIEERVERARKLITGSTDSTQPPACFRMTSDTVTIEISGTPSAVCRIVCALDQALMA